ECFFGMFFLHLADMELERNIIHCIPPFLECIVAYTATRLYETGYGSKVCLAEQNLWQTGESMPLPREIEQKSASATDNQAWQSKTCGKRAKACLCHGKLSKRVPLPQKSKHHYG
ncbi:MAG: hypothetical protein IJS33_01735, partial [Firmicutes bacterium]|nr:hypothetical protein [Bacillota bacterium]